VQGSLLKVSSLSDVEHKKYRGVRLRDHRLLWARSHRPGDPYDYRLQGRNLLVECDNTQRGVPHSETSDVTRLPSITDVSIDSNDPSTCRWSFVRALMIVVDVKNSCVSLHPKLSREANY